VGQKEVIGFEVAVDDRCGVRLVERDRSLSEIGEYFGKRQGSKAFDALAKFFPTQQLHDHERSPRGFVDAGIGDIDDVFAFDVGGDAGFTFEAFTEFVALEDVRVHDLERATAVCLGVEHFIDGAHAALSDEAHDAVATGKDRALGEWGGHEASVAPNLEFVKDLGKTFGEDWVRSGKTAGRDKRLPRLPSAELGEKMHAVLDKRRIIAKLPLLHAHQTF
jgi:hypothetical protein